MVKLYRSSMLISYGTSDIQVLDESSISNMSVRKSLDQERLKDTNDSYRTMLGLPEDR
jgi:hypothetical protein